ncbi:hypothetical protein ON010_g14737 [Phytophthora cinnamomi]|nr:hypothetical protein ON010_g14737 [Phytophthora cinnamomi]
MVDNIEVPSIPNTSHHDGPSVGNPTSAAHRLHGSTGQHPDSAARLPTHQRPAVPTTIDSAVYNELDRVIEVYEPFRPWSKGAMDGAATRGRLDLLKKLRCGRSAECSSAAFTDAAGNNKLKVLRWLHRYYGQQSRPSDELKAAAERSHMQVIQFMRPKMRNRHVGPALEDYYYLSACPSTRAG